MTRLRGNKEGWHSADIVAAVRKNGSSLVAISESLGLTRSAASRALLRPHARVNKAIAALIGAPLHEIWPQWFDADGERISARLRPRSRPRSPTTRVSESNPAAYPPSKTAA
ncbi:MAG: helix-turn-helix domain-containing protein [Roseiarcus sp.]|jgi:Ner family transcriptional regulator